MIQGELQKLGFVVSERSVARYLRRIRRRDDPGKRWLDRQCAPGRSPSSLFLAPSSVEQSASANSSPCPRRPVTGAQRTSIRRNGSPQRPEGRLEEGHVAAAPPRRSRKLSAGMACPTPPRVGPRGSSPLRNIAACGRSCSDNPQRFWLPTRSYGATAPVLDPTSRKSCSQPRAAPTEPQTQSR